MLKKRMNKTIAEIRDDYPYSYGINHTSVNVQHISSGLNCLILIYLTAKTFRFSFYILIKKKKTLLNNTNNF
jgi:hypothetical protein